MRRQIDVLSDEHSSFRIIWSLAWPIMLEQVLIMLVQYVDTAMVGAIGPDATAARRQLYRRKQNRPGKGRCKAERAGDSLVWSGAYGYNAVHRAVFAALARRGGEHMRGRYEVHINSVACIYSYRVRADMLKHTALHGRYGHAAYIQRFN